MAHFGIDSNFIFCEPVYMIERTPKELEIARRIRLAVYAYAYEFLFVSLVDDHTFDQIGLQVDLTIDTGRPHLDVWFRQNFDPSTGMWIRNHPELNKIISIFWYHYAKKAVKL